MLYAIGGPNAPLLLDSPEDALFGIVCVMLAVQQVWMLMSGRVVPGRTVDTLMKAKDEEVAQKQATIDRLVNLLGQQMVAGQTAIRAAEAIQEIKS